VIVVEPGVVGHGPLSGVLVGLHLDVGLIDARHSSIVDRLGWEHQVDLVRHVLIQHGCLEDGMYADRVAGDLGGEVALHGVRSRKGDLHDHLDDEGVVTTVVVGVHPVVPDAGEPYLG
jgi:hypothetical protein